MLKYFSCFGASLSIPPLIMTTTPARGIMVCQCAALSCVCCTLVPEIHVCLDMFHVFRYINVLTRVIYN